MSVPRVARSSARHAAPFEVALGDEGCHPEALRDRHGHRTAASEQPELAKNPREGRGYRLGSRYARPLPGPKFSKVKNGLNPAAVKLGSPV